MLMPLCTPYFFLHPPPSHTHSDRKIKFHANYLLWKVVSLLLTLLLFPTPHILIVYVLWTRHFSDGIRTKWLHGRDDWKTGHRGDRQAVGNPLHGLFAHYSMLNWIHILHQNDKLNFLLWCLAFLKTIVTNSYAHIRPAVAHRKPHRPGTYFSRAKPSL